MYFIHIVLLLVTLLISMPVNALNIQPVQSLPPSQLQQSSSSNSSRRTFLNHFVTTTTTSSAFLVATASTKANSVEINDLAMPTAQEQKGLDADAIMAERIRRKVEMQKELAQPKTFTESFQKERTKQKSLNSQTKEERRNAMCEELGRGC